MDMMNPIRAILSCKRSRTDLRKDIYGIWSLRKEKSHLKPPLLDLQRTCEIRI